MYSSSECQLLGDLHRWSRDSDDDDDRRGWRRGRDDDDDRGGWRGRERRWRPSQLAWPG